jgi:hypothetical protein
MLLTIGLALTVVGWIIQLCRTIIKKDRNFSIYFIIVYAVGCLLLSIGNFMGNDTSAGILNALDVVLPVILLIILLVVSKNMKQA